MKIRKINSTASDFNEKVQALLNGYEEPDNELKSVVEKIIQDVCKRGDDALLEYTNRFDNRDADISDLEIDTVTLDNALKEIPDDIHSGLVFAADRIRNYHEKQKLDSWQFKDKDGNTLGQQITPLDNVGVYVPGGKAAYPSSVLMNVIPAKVAGVKQVVMTVPLPGGESNPLVLAAARIAEVDRVFTVGGAQAIAAMAFGTEIIPSVDKIVGPGNRYVAMAKRLVFGRVGIDMIAGPSEVLVICDGTVNPEWVTMDLFAQAEHDEDARAILISTDAAYIDTVEQTILRLLPEMERADIIRSSLEKHGALINVRDLDEAVDLANRIAPEHLELAIVSPEQLLPRIRHAGAIFVGQYAAEVLGDYCAGPNHVLPTSRTARFSSPLGVYDFQKRSSVIMCTEESASGIAKTASVLAMGEGLTAHARSAKYRIKD